MPAERHLVVNPGSSSLKLSVLEGGSVVVASDEADLSSFLREAPAVDAAGVRVVHGGPTLRSSVLVTDEIMSQLEAIDDLAPLHNPASRRALAAVREARPDVPVVACFDTAFHATLPDAAATYAVPWSWTSELGVRRYGFHGLSHSYLSRRAAELTGGARIVTCHLGAGASLAAVLDGVCVDTTMGFTPDEGLVMATRSGSVDPGALLWVMERLGLSVEDARQAIEGESGLLGVSGVSADMRAVLAAARDGHARARLALDVYIHRLRASVAAMAASLGGLDVLVFSGGVGENAPEIRDAACDGLDFLAPFRTLVIESREDLEISREIDRVRSS